MENDTLRIAIDSAYRAALKQAAELCDEVAFKYGRRGRGGIQKCVAAVECRDKIRAKLAAIV